MDILHIFTLQYWHPKLNSNPNTNSNPKNHPTNPT